MRFPTDDQLWTATAEFVQRHRRPGDRVLGPAEFTEPIPGLATATGRSEPLEGFTWLVVHKGRLDQFDAERLKAVVRTHRPVFANEVFVVLAANPALPDLDRRNVHVQALRERLSALPTGRPPAAPRVVPPFEVQPYVQAVPDPVLRADPRDRLNQLCDISDWRAGPMLEHLAAMREPVRIHRKPWECGKCLAGLERLGMLRPDVTALSVGAGAERSLFHLANRVERIVATDLYLDQADQWGWGADFLAEPARFAPFPYRREALQVLDMSGLDLRFPDASFDVVYTLSSIEHFGGHGAAAAAMREMARVTRPGGIVCVVTELVLSVTPAPDYFTLPELREHLVEASPLRLVEPEIDTRISESLLAHPVVPGRDPGDVSPQIVVAGLDGRTAWTSVILFFRR
ncbi:MAG TPA: methyltransferase domain-containing protein [Candidatus Dormibacteraeota bacterium]|nr:methyltransferase domain-containing protein [Candidatus Dormibacteraeota bacterium]